MSLNLNLITVLLKEKSQYNFTINFCVTNGAATVHRSICVVFAGKFVNKHRPVFLAREYESLGVPFLPSPTPTPPLLLRYVSFSTMARLRATTNQNKRRVEATGKRTGVSILSQEIQVQPNGFEDPDAFFSQARSPSFTEKENPRNQIKTTRFSVGSLQQHQDDVSTSTGQTKRMMGRIKGLTSPSELSRVSTAPASPESVARQKQQHREDPIVDSPGPIMNDDDEYDDEIEEQVRQQSPIADEREEEEEEQQPLIPEATKDDDDTVNGESSIVEDDFMPPRPPDSPERDDESEIPTRTDNHADIPTQMSADEEGVDEDEDGPGYSMPSSKTPESAKIIRKEKKESKKKDKVSNKNESKKRKKAANETMSDDDSEQKPKKKIIAQRNKKSRYATYFSPKGIPLPMEYESVPVDRLRNTQEVEVNGKPCRRSKRARCSPLAFWKNEKLEYGPNDDLDATSDLARMPIPKAVIKAKETPYKPRTVRPRVVSASAKKKTKAASVPVEEAPMLKFDSRKLRKKYEYVDDEQAVLWDEDTEESQKMSKCTIWSLEIHISDKLQNRSTNVILIYNRNCGVQWQCPVP